MIRGRLTEYECKSDFLRLIYNRSRIYSLNVFVIGKGQVGKSTFVKWCACMLKALEKGIPKKDMTWTEWDHTKFTTTTPQDFVRLWDENEHEVLALEEAGQQLYYLDFQNIMSRVFSSTTNTQGLKKNVCFLITPHFSDIVKHARESIDFVVILHNRNDAKKTVIATPKYVVISWKNFKPMFRPISNMIMQYNDKFLIEARKYTDYLKVYKKDISNMNKELVGIIKKPTLGEELKTEIDKEIIIKPVRIKNQYVY